MPQATSAPLLPTPNAFFATDASGLGRKALVTGSVALGTLLTSTLLLRRRQRRLVPAEELPPAVEGVQGTFEVMEGTLRYTHRPGAGTPVVLLHSINAVGSSFEMKPLYDHLAATTDRPLYAMDWLGFGRSDRPPVAYGPALYERHLRRFLSEVVHEPADLVALSLPGAYAAQVALAAPFLVRRLALLMPTALKPDGGPPLALRLFATATGSAGVFALFFDRLTEPESLRSFYARRIVRDPARVPEALLRYGALTARVEGAHHAPQRFIQGRLEDDTAARHAYAGLQVPTRLWVTDDTAGLVQSFELADEVSAANPDHLSLRRLPGGLLPQWEHPEVLLPEVIQFLA